MFVFGAKSQEKLKTCHPNIVLVMERGLMRSPYDITIIHGWRGEEVQNALFESQASTKWWPHSKHNNTDDEGFPLSLAVDYAPWVNGQVYWEDTHIFAVIAGVIMAAADELGIEVRWGGDWDGDGQSTDQTLMDYGHMELVL